MKAPVSIVTGLAALLLWVGAAQAQERIRIGLAVPKAAAYVGLHVAEDRGFFKEAKLNPEITVFRGGAAAAEAMTAGAVDLITFIPGGVGLARTKGSKAKVVGTIDDKPLGWHLLVKADSPIKSVDELAGKKLGITVKGGATDMLAIWLTSNAKVNAQIIPVGGAAINNALLSGQVDAIVATPSGTWQMMEAGQAKSIYDFGSNMKPIVADAWVASGDIMEKRPEVLRAALLAIYRGTRHIQENRDWGRGYLKAFTEEKDDRINEISYNELVLKLSKDGMTERAWVEESLKMAADAWGNDDVRKVSPDDVFTNEFLSPR